MADAGDPTTLALHIGTTHVFDPSLALLARIPEYHLAGEVRVFGLPPFYQGFRSHAGLSYPVDLSESVVMVFEPMIGAFVAASIDEARSGLSTSVSFDFGFRPKSALGGYGDPRYSLRLSVTALEAFVVIPGLTFGIVL